MSSRSPERVHVVIERTDGSRIVRLPAPRWLVSVAVGIGGLALVAAGAFYTDYVALKTQREQFAALQTRLTEQQQVIDGFQQRVSRVRAEVDSWRDLREKIWQPFGPEGDTPARGSGIGGGTAQRHLETTSGPRLSILDELDELTAVVTDEGENLRALERFIGKAGKALASLPSRWPVRGPVNSGFGGRASPWSTGSTEFHGGLDIGAPRGTAVMAPAPGTVVLAGSHPEYGVTLVIDHGNDIKTLYGHLTKATVAQGQQVQRGQQIGLTGNTGRSSGAHLHYEIQVKGQPVNPRSYLWD